MMHFDRFPIFMVLKMAAYALDQILFFYLISSISSKVLSNFFKNLVEQHHKIDLTLSIDDSRKTSGNPICENWQQC